MTVRAAELADLGPLTTVWYEGWNDAHAHLVPAELARVRTFESFEHRLKAALARVRVLGPAGAPVGFHMLEADEVHQLYVAAPSRGSGVAALLMADAEARLRELGVGLAWLACAIGNHRAARFYEKCGWRRAGTRLAELETSNGPFSLEVWRYEKALQ